MNERPYLTIAIDQSTSGTKVLLVSDKIEDRFDLKHKQIYPKKGWVEHDPLEIIENVKQGIDALISRNDLQYSDVSNISITNQRETIVAWDKITGKPFYNALVWQCKRSSDICIDLKEKGFDAIIKSKTGLILDPYFSAPKIKWLIDNVQEIQEANNNGTVCFGTIDSWITWNLTDGTAYVTDMSNACRTMLFNIHTNEWDDELLKLFGVNIKCLPHIKKTVDYFGQYKSIPITVMIADSQSSLFANGCINVGDAKATLGTGCSIMVQLGHNDTMYNTLVETIAWQVDEYPNYAVEGVIRSLGDTIEWARNELCLFNSFEEVTEILQSFDSHGVHIVPGQLGIGTPYWKSKTNASIHGLGRSSTKNDIIQAVFNSVIFQIKQVIDTVYTETKCKVRVLKLDGGISKNCLLMQKLADLLEIEVLVSNDEELSAIGSVNIGRLNPIEGSYNIYKPSYCEKIIQSYNEWVETMDKSIIQS